MGKKLAATLYGLERLDPQELNANQLNKLQHRCQHWTQMRAREDRLTPPPDQTPAQAVGDWERKIELMESAQVQYIPKRLLLSMRAAVEQLEGKVGREANRRYWDEMPSITPERRSRSRSKSQSTRRRKRRTSKKL